MLGRRKAVPGAVPGDPGLQMAYAAIVESLKAQDHTLAGLRNRATGVLSTAALAASFAAGVGLINTDATAGAVFPRWASLALLATLIAIGVFDSLVLWPIRGWQFGPDVDQMLVDHDGGRPLPVIQRHAIDDAVAGARRNAGLLKPRFTFYRWSACLLIVEVIVMLSAVVGRQS
jgi:hypothetical protein